MDNAQKAIMIGVGLFITIIIISAVLLITNLGTGLMSGAQTELGGISAGLKNQILDAYDGKTMSGTEILAAVRQYSNSTTVSMIITQANTNYYVGAGVITLPSNPVYQAGGITGGTVKKLSEYDSTETKPTIQTYSTIASLIPANKYYNTAVVYNAEGNVIGIAAMQK